MNREQRERHEQGETDFTNFRSFRVFHGSLQGTLPFSFFSTQERRRGEFGIQNGERFSPKPLRAYWGHSVFCSRFSRISRLKLQGTLRLKSMNREQRERHEQGETDFTNFRSFRVFHGKNTGDTPFY